MKSQTLAVGILVLFAVASMESKTINLSAAAPIVVGADLKAYKKPTRKVCTVTVPEHFPTIQEAINAVVSGSTVCVDGGIYDENVVINKSIRLSGNGFAAPSIISPHDLHFGVFVDADDVVVEGFVINGIGSTWQSSALLLGEGRTNIVGRSNRMGASNGADVVIAYGNSTDHVFDNNVLVGDNSPQIIAVNGTPDVGKPSIGMTFINNSFIGTVTPTSRDDSGIALLSQAADNLVRNNVFDATGAITVVQCAYSSNRINENNFNSETTSLVKVRTGFDGTSNAENNWWGDLDPSDNVLGDIDFSPFAAVPFRQTK